jgi:Protein of unknown function (DUF4058)
MSTPFPGVDPFLESQGYWPDFHTRFMTYCCDAVADILPPSYDARLGEQLRLVELTEPQARTVYPDVAVLQGGPVRGGAAGASRGVLTMGPLVINLPTEEMEEVRDVWIEIRRRPDRNLVTAIEILSPTNKVGEGFWEYRAKRRKLIRQKVHLVELDLLVGGRRLEMEQELPPADFYAFVSRAERRPKSEVYAWSIRQPLPRIPIPLLAPDPDVNLDLPSLFALGYERGRYDRALDYSAPLELPLAPADRAWAEELARKAKA